MKKTKLMQMVIIGFCGCCIAIYAVQSIYAEGEKSMKPPAAKISIVKESMHGIEISDPYRWLENWDDTAVRAWSDQQNAYSRYVLDNLPGVDAISKRVSYIVKSASVDYYSLEWKKNNLFALKDQPPLNQPLLVVMQSANKPDAAKVIVDPNKLDTKGSTAIDWYVPSPDGSKVAVSLSVGGSEMGNVQIFETATGKPFHEVVERVNGGTAGGDLAWLADGSGFYYTRYPYPGERPDKDLPFYQQVWMHKLGTMISKDRYIIGKDFEKTAEIQLETDDASGMLLVTVQSGDSMRFKYYLVQPDGKAMKIADYDDMIMQANFGPGGNLFLISRKDAPRGKVLRMSLKTPDLKKAITIIPENKDTIVSSFGSKSELVATATRLYLIYQMGGPSEIRAFDHDGKPQAKPKQLLVSSVGGITALDGDKILFRNSSYIQAPAWYEYNGVSGSTAITALIFKSPVDFSDCEVARKDAVSKDGTHVPVNIIYQKSIKLDGSHPVLLTGYGGFGVSQSPHFLGVFRVWIEQGGIVALANIRGGGEFGESWHQDGKLMKKQNGFDDFAAAMQYLIKSGYARPDKLSIVGGSNGGLLMGAMITQHPDLFKASVSYVGIYDMIHSELTPNGSFNIPEYGTVKDPEQFKALYAYSPYHNVKKGVAYPAVLFMTGANDPRVDPMHSRKMTAALQSASASANPILLRTSTSTGHGIGTPLGEQIKELTDQFAFLFHELDITYKPVAK